MGASRYRSADTEREECSREHEERRRTELGVSLAWAHVRAWGSGKDVLNQLLISGFPDAPCDADDDDVGMARQQAICGARVPRDRHCHCGCEARVFLLNVK